MLGYLNLKLYFQVGWDSLVEPMEEVTPLALPPSLGSSGLWTHNKRHLILRFQAIPINYNIKSALKIYIRYYKILLYFGWSIAKTKGSMQIANLQVHAGLIERNEARISLFPIVSIQATAKYRGSRKTIYTYSLYDIGWYASSDHWVVNTNKKCIFIRD